MGAYVFDHKWQKERDRLGALELLFDASSERILVDRGLTTGWRCLEVGCGAGGIARRMATLVGASGSVVATDLNAELVDVSDHPNLELRHHNLLTDTFEAESFDLVHARAVIEHLNDRQGALSRLVSAVRRGGWVVVEDVDFGEAIAGALARYLYPPEGLSLIERMYRAVEAVFAGGGADASFGCRLPGALKEAGLTAVGAEVRAPLVSAGTDEWVSSTVEQLAGRLIATNIVTDDDIEAFLALRSAYTSHYLPPLMVAAWGQKP